MHIWSGEEDTIEQGQEEDTVEQSSSKDQTLVQRDQWAFHGRKGDSLIG
jgi:hypothetical protein